MVVVALWPVSKLLLFVVPTTMMVFSTMLATAVAAAAAGAARPSKKTATPQCILVVSCYYDLWLFFVMWCLDTTAMLYNRHLSPTIHKFLLPALSYYVAFVFFLSDNNRIIIPNLFPFFFFISCEIFFQLGSYLSVKLHNKFGSRVRGFWLRIFAVSTRRVPITIILHKRPLCKFMCVVLVLSSSAR